MRRLFARFCLAQPQLLLLLHCIFEGKMANPPSFMRFSKCRIVSNSPSIATESKALIQHVRAIPAHRWEFTLTTVAMNLEEQRRAMAWAFGLLGRKGVFETTVPRYSKPLGKALGAPTVRANASAGNSIVQLQGFIGSVIGQLIAGDFIRFSNHNKVYQIQSDVNSNGSGQLTIQIMPQLTTDLPVSTSLIMNSVPFSFRLARDIQEFEASTSGSGFVTYELDVIEAL